uniref:Tetraspanin n=1 Tax=Riptortus pedestris TaxID=329032 RepID=R4WRZ3_RIPPE|nr:tetraspanin, putative [Riptortus pedestris]
MGFFSCTSKFILFFFNLIVVMLSAAILGIGIYAILNNKTYGGTLSTPAIIFIVIGCAITIVAFLGCWGAIQENRCYLHLYASILLVLLLILIAIGAAVIIRKDQTEASLLQFLGTVFDKGQSDDVTSKTLIDEIQSSFKCCGMDGPQEYIWNLKPIPASCCYGGNSCNAIDAYKDGCQQKVLNFLKYDLKLLGIFAIVVGVVELLGVVFAFILSTSIKRQNMRGHV